MKRQFKIFSTVSIFLVFLSNCIRSGDQNRTTSTTGERKSLDPVKVSQYRAGQKVFRRLCNSCHYAPELHKLDQHDFPNLFETLPAPSESYFERFVSDSKALKDSGDKYALDLAKVYPSKFEHRFRDSMTKGDIRCLIIYINLADKRSGPLNE